MDKNTLKETSFKYDGRKGGYIIRINIFNGEVTQCSCKKDYYCKSASKGQDNFYNVLKDTLEKLIRHAPNVFMEVYRSLFLSTRDFKVAKQIQENEIERLKSKIKCIQTVYTQ